MKNTVKALMVLVLSVFLAVPVSAVVSSVTADEIVQVQYPDGEKKEKKECASEKKACGEKKACADKKEGEKACADKKEKSAEVAKK